MTDAPPVFTTPSGGPTLPIESERGLGGFVPGVEAAYGDSLGERLISRAVGAVQGWGQPLIPKDKAAEAVKEQGLDPAFIGEDGITQAALAREMSRQTAVKMHQVEVQRADTSSVGRFVASTIGGLGDPLNLSLMLLAPYAALPEAGLVGRVAMGAAEGAAYNAGTSAGIDAISGHDEDILSWQTVREAAFGALIGGSLHGVLGPRITPEVKGADLRDVGNMAIAQAAKDSVVNVEPLLDRLGAMKLPDIEQGGAAWSADALSRLGPTADQIRAGNAHLPTVGETSRVRTGETLRALDKAASLTISDSGRGLPAKLPELIDAFRVNGMDLPTFLDANADRLPANAGQTLRSLREAAQYADTPGGKEKADQDLAHYLGTLKLPELERGGPSTPVALKASLDRMAARDPQFDMTSATPKPGSAITEQPDLKAALARIEEHTAEAKPVVQPKPGVIPVPPEVDELQQQTAAALKDAEHAHSMIAPNGDFKSVMAEHDEAAAQDGELSKAIEAAVRCGAFNGLD